MQDFVYLMENEEEALRLDVKTDPEAVRRHALWAGLKPGMRVADVGCGAGKTTSVLHGLVQPGGTATGIDISRQRIDYATEHYGGAGIEFVRADARQSLEHLGSFDFVWVRFLLEYYLKESADMVANISETVKPGGILCLIDLDYNCLSHYGLSERLEGTIANIMNALRSRANFDPFAGRKLYSYIYGLGYEDIAVDLSAHHLIYGALKDSDRFNWEKKVEVAARKVGYSFSEYPGGFPECQDEFKAFFASPGRFTYTPAMVVRGIKPAS